MQQPTSESTPAELKDPWQPSNFEQPDDVLSNPTSPSLEDIKPAAHWPPKQHVLPDEPVFSAPRNRLTKNAIKVTAAAAAITFAIVSYGTSNGTKDSAQLKTVSQRREPNAGKNVTQLTQQNKALKSKLSSQEAELARRDLAEREGTQTTKTCSKISADPFNLYIGLLHKEVLLGRACEILDQVAYIKSYINSRNVETDDTCIQAWNQIKKAARNCTRSVALSLKMKTSTEAQ